jgi:hypothetical protein
MLLRYNNPTGKKTIHQIRSIWMTAKINKAQSISALMTTSESYLDPLRNSPA